MKDKGVVAKLYRIEHWFYKHHLKVISKLFYYLIYLLFNCVIPPSVVIGKNLHIAHGVGIVLHHDLIMGDDCTIYQNVTIGGGEIKIGNNVLIGANAVVLGSITIGNNVKIGACTFVNSSVKDNKILVGCKAREIERKKNEN